MYDHQVSNLKLWIPSSPFRSSLKVMEIISGASFPKTLSNGLDQVPTRNLLHELNQESLTSDNLSRNVPSSGLLHQQDQTTLEPMVSSSGKLPLDKAALTIPQIKDSGPTGFQQMILGLFYSRFANSLK
ncbi:unnamed protein product [Larinioides sclopetarius]|uniref:Uncharacterized protein n=1 Tax=Larinioides sclopetarius TaxID=280406 RepID=A0AAV2BJ85_9ARAC